MVSVRIERTAAGAAPRAQRKGACASGAGAGHGSASRVYGHIIRRVQDPEGWGMLGPSAVQLARATAHGTHETRQQVASREGSRRLVMSGLIRPQPVLLKRTKAIARPCRCPNLLASAPLLRGLEHG